MDEFDRFDGFDIVFANETISEKKAKEHSELFKENLELLSIIPKCEQGLECDHCGYCH